MAEEKKDPKEDFWKGIEKEKQDFLSRAADYRDNGRGAAHKEAVNRLIEIYNKAFGDNKAREGGIAYKDDSYEGAMYRANFASDKEGSKKADTTEAENKAREDFRKAIGEGLSEYYGSDEQKKKQVEQMLTDLDPVPTCFGGVVGGLWDKFTDTVYKDKKVQLPGVGGLVAGAVAGWAIGSQFFENPFGSILCAIVLAIAGAFVGAALSATGGGGSIMPSVDTKYHLASAAGVNGQEKTFAQSEQIEKPVTTASIDTEKLGAAMKKASAEPHKKEAASDGLAALENGETPSSAGVPLAKTAGAGSGKNPK